MFSFLLENYTWKDDFGTVFQISFFFYSIEYIYKTNPKKFIPTQMLRSLSFIGRHVGRISQGGLIWHPYRTPCNDHWNYDPYTQKIKALEIKLCSITSIAIKYAVFHDLKLQSCEEKQALKDVMTWHIEHRFEDLAAQKKLVDSEMRKARTHYEKQCGRIAASIIITENVVSKTDDRFRTEEKLNQLPENTEALVRFHDWNDELDK